MNSKFWRESRETCRLFCLEYEEDSELAISNLKMRLEGKRKRIVDMTMMLIKNRIPWIND